jgi:Dullard-like phosphatase family protein
LSSRGQENTEEILK